VALAVGGFDEQVHIVPAGWGTDVQPRVEARGAPDAVWNRAVAPYLGFRGYFAESCTTPGVYSQEAYLGLSLLGKTLRYSVDLSGAGCGCNAALSLASMRQNAEAGACGDYFCDSSLTCGTPCAEVNIQEANRFAWHSTLHTATDPAGAAAGFGGESVFDGPRDFSSSDYGPSGRCIDTSQPFQVSASFPINSEGELQSMFVTLSQPGRECDLEMLVGKYSGMLSVGTALAEGMTPVINYWASDDMKWLDGVGSDGQGPCVVDDVSACAASVVFSDFSISPMAAAQRVDPIAAATSETSKPFDCTAGYPEGTDSWSEEQLEWCCRNEHKGCAPRIAQPIAEPMAEPPATTAPATTAPATTAQPGAPGDRSIQEQQRNSPVWIDRAATSTGAPQPFDCTAGYPEWIDGWTQEQLTWCCRNEHKGCGAQAPGPAPPSVSSLSGGLSCVANYPTELAGDGDQERRSACLRGNSLKDGFGYWYNAGRGTDSAACKGDCWCCRRDLRKIPDRRAWALAATGTSCKNWQRIQIFRTTTVDDPSVCGQLCRAHQGCVEFAYLSNDTCSDAGVKAKGSCMLFFGACDRQPSSCWDLYSMHVADGSEVEQPLARLNRTAVTATRMRTATTTTTTIEAPARSLPVGVSDPMLLPDTAIDENLHSLTGQLVCANPPVGHPGDDARSRCLRGNMLKDGHSYVHNRERGTPTSCGDCDCCQRDTSAVPETRSYMLKASGTSCRNWAHIKMFRSVVVNHSSVCAMLCAANSGCVQFAYIGADSCSEVGVSEKGSCMLFSGGCEMQTSSCWTLYAMQTAEPNNWGPLLGQASQAIGLRQQRQTALRTTLRSGAGHDSWSSIVVCPLMAIFAGAVVVAIRRAKARQPSSGRPAPAQGFLDLNSCCSPRSLEQLLAMSPERPVRGRGLAGAFDE
jgi:hypothetical protein